MKLKLPTEFIILIILIVYIGTMSYMENRAGDEIQNKRFDLRISQQIKILVRSIQIYFYMYVIIKHN